MNTGAIDKIYNYLSGEKDFVDLSLRSKKEGKSICHG